MNKEQQDIILDVYREYCLEQSKYLTHGGTIQEFINKCKTEDALSLKWREEYRNLQYGSKEEIEHLSKHYTSDTEFSERWGLKIEERELSRDERCDEYIKRHPKETNDGILNYKWIGDNLCTHEDYDKWNIPTKLITITYNDKKIESYE
jgi:hypothetical protein